MLFVTVLLQLFGISMLALLTVIVLAILLDNNLFGEDDSGSSPTSQSTGTTYSDLIQRLSRVSENRINPYDEILSLTGTRYGQV